MQRSSENVDCDPENPRQPTCSGRDMTTATVHPLSPAARRRMITQGLLRAFAATAVSSTGFDGGFQLPLSGLLGEGCAAVGGLVLDWWDEPDLPVEPAEVEPVDVLGDRDLEVVDALPRSAVADQFGLEQ